ncbi:MAG: hypothetical protein ACXABY_00505 [Candidatus Thorarchaeota archaeon]|jgi:hypothetical protein
MELNLRFNARRDLTGTGAKKAAVAAKPVPDRALWFRRAKFLSFIVAYTNINRTCNADQVQQALADRYPGYEPSMLGPSAGNLFRGRDWVYTGEQIMSERESNRRALKVWKLKRPAGGYLGG